MKEIGIEYPAGTSVVIMLNNKPVSTRIRSVEYHESIEMHNDPDTGEKESLKTSVKYSTFAAPNKSLSANDIGLSNEELIEKKFSNSKQ